MPMDLNTLYVIALFTLLVLGIGGLLYQKIRDARSPERKMTDAELDAALAAVGFPSTPASPVIEPSAKTKHQSTSEQTEAGTSSSALPIEPPAPLTLEERVTLAVERYGSAVEFVTSP